MNCKKCGTELNEQTPFCPYCGAEIPKEEPSPAQPSDQVSQQNKKDNYKAYIPQTRVKMYYRIAASVLSLVLVLLFLFLPIYHFRLPASSQGYQTFTQLPEKKQQQAVQKLLSQDGQQYGLDEKATLEFFYLMSEESRESYIREAIIDGEAPVLSYSAFDELKEFFRFLGKGDMGYVDAFNLMVFLFSLFEWVFGIIIIIGCGKKIYDDVSGLKNLDETTLLAYEQIKRSGGKAEKLKFLQKQSIITIVIYAVFDAVFGKVDRFLLDTMAELGEASSTVAYNTMITGLSGSAILIVMGLVGYFVLNSFIKKKDEQMSIAILRED